MQGKENFSLVMARNFSNIDGGNFSTALVGFLRMRAKKTETGCILTSWNCRLTATVLFL